MFSYNNSSSLPVLLYCRTMLFNNIEDRFVMCTVVLGVMHVHFFFQTNNKNSCIFSLCLFTAQTCALSMPAGTVYNWFVPKVLDLDHDRLFFKENSSATFVLRFGSTPGKLTYVHKDLLIKGRDGKMAHTKRMICCLPSGMAWLAFLVLWPVFQWNLCHIHSKTGKMRKRYF